MFFFIFPHREWTRRFTQVVTERAWDPGRELRGGGGGGTAVRGRPPAT